ncbi:MAG: hypothetical protein A3G70_00155 [Planctomycetes bacterium RIFCSPLOWO2_12_FULL_39_13]|nr:MAG: hypothetical protein A2Y09_07035 [Planctomycetes bacterium GWA2_39_15]OHB41455.1 MAG: hypothetical protein A2Y11_04690 [Planctomycetes bacterium GWC2_39_26]OHB99959.1 MAG: hypothetical protein A3G70_00155 [Planctomycetes bacterium RIFCSPLOWO2_12_FULL_39_13]
MFELTLLSVCSVSAFIWLALTFMPARWRMSERWEAVGNPYLPVSKLPSLSVIVPARNESTSLPQTLPSWLAQEYPESEIILIDDDSSDGTEDCARGIAEQYKHDVRILKGIPPPPGWTGKLWALQQGISVSSGEWLLFTDADIRHSPNLWRGLVTKAMNEQRAMVSLMALLDTVGMWARLLIPAFVYFFHLLYPFDKVKDLRSKVTAAAGGCILISRQALDKIGGIAGHSDAWIDDLALAKRIKRAGLSLSLSLTKSAVSIRPYRQLCDVWNMVSRSAFTQLQCSWLALIGTVLGMSILFIFPIFGIFLSGIGGVYYITASISFFAFLLMSVTYIPILRFYNLSLIQAFTLPLTGTLYLTMTVSSAINHVVGRREWRGTRSKIN